jgi:exodeoxyribonuclease VIII
MIDIETLDTADTAVILQIGGCIFDESGENTQKFDMRLSWVDGQCGRTISASTVDWWLKQDAEMRQRVFYEGYRFFPKEACMEMLQLFTNVNYFWAKGKFDFNILENMFQQCNICPPWSFRQIFDYRTMLVMASLRYGYVETKSNTHNAMDDAVNQAKNLVNILNLMDRR